MVTMRATVLEVQEDNLLVLDQETSQEVVVHTQRASCFCVGNNICIQYSGIMTRSIPPQITATRICPVRCSGNR